MFPLVLTWTVFRSASTNTDPLPRSQKRRKSNRYEVLKKFRASFYSTSYPEGIILQNNRRNHAPAHGQRPTRRKALPERRAAVRRSSLSVLLRHLFACLQPWRRYTRL